MNPAGNPPPPPPMNPAAAINNLHLQYQAPHFLRLDPNWVPDSLDPNSCKRSLK